MEDNRRPISPNRRRSALVLLLAVGALATAGVAGTVLWGRGNTASARPGIGSPESQATIPIVGAATAQGGGDSQSTAAGGNSASKPGDPASASDPGPESTPGPVLFSGPYV